ncbi:peroxiredoxin-like family protein [Cytobacillus sp. IB215665]|uniref:peroxiredoxin-like family protein n=1 Tax=Cytobacillus sp. IB215665 TaxID=3097357 RepID=UPI002A0FA819|nr:peroxiredoxin-like family protein [Cytobacillus sp. IB215665]MDX8365765.1 peroxiredoxin-like family protein [Cytobacillus sp. IB215665]
MSILTTLAEQLKAYNENAVKKMPEEVLNKMVQATTDLAQSDIAKGLEIGDHAPDFTLSDPTGKELNLYEQLKKGPVILTFYRGEWCPYCNLELRAYQQALPEINALGAQLIAISPQTPDHSLSMKEKNELAYPVLSDVGSHVIKEYNLLFDLPKYLVEVYKGFGINLEEFNDSDWSLPVPATFIIDKNGKIRLASVNPDYTKRMEPSEVINELQSL